MQRGEILAVAIDTELIMLGRDILKWLEKVKALHKQWKGGATILHEEIFIDQAYGKIKQARTELQALSEKLKKKEGANLAACTASIKKMRQGFNNLRRHLTTMLGILTAMRDTVVKELEDDAYVKRDLAAIEALWWELQDIVKTSRAHRIVRKLISHTRYSERKEKTMESFVKDVIDTINAKINKISTQLMPNLAIGVQKELGKDEQQVMSALAKVSSRAELAGIIDNYIADSGMICHALVENVYRIAMKDLTKMIDSMQRIWDRTERFEEREGALLRELEISIKELEESGEIPEKEMAA